MITVTVWILFAIGGSGEMIHIGDYKMANACQEAAREGANKGIAARCMETKQIVPKAYFESLR